MTMIGVSVLGRARISSAIYGLGFHGASGLQSNLGRQCRLSLWRYRCSLSVPGLKETNGVFRRAARNQKRGFCSKTGQGQSVQESAAQGAPPPTTITFKQGAKVATTGTIWIGIAALVGVCGWYIARELMPTKLSPNQIFNHAFQVLRDHPEMKARLGDGIKGYGADRNRHKEGRRNYVEHDSYTDIDGIKRCRVVFNMEGSLGKATVYAEVAENTPKGEFTYIIVEQVLHGRPVAVALVDNRPHVTRGELQEKIVSRLVKGGVELYGMSNCPWTQRQLLELGEFSDRITAVMCDRDENKEKCEKAKELGLPGFPAWKVGSEMVGGFMPLENLEQMCLSGAF